MLTEVAVEVEVGVERREAAVVYRMEVKSGIEGQDTRSPQVTQLTTINKPRMAVMDGCGITPRGY